MSPLKSYDILMTHTSHEFAWHTPVMCLQTAHQLVADVCQDRKKIWETGSPRSRIRDLGGSWIVFLFCHGISETMDPVTATLPWDPRDLGSRTEKILLDPEDPGSSLSRLSWDVADLGSYKTTLSLYSKHLLHPMKFCYWFPIFMCCLKTWAVVKISTTHWFNHSVLTWKIAHLVGSTTCFLL